MTIEYREHLAKQMKLVETEVELKKLEHMVNKMTDIQEASCVLDTDSFRLYVFYAGDMESNALRSNLCEQIPSYLLPDCIVQMEKLPYTKSGKINRIKLLRLARKKENESKC